MKPGINLIFLGKIVFTITVLNLLSATNNCSAQQSQEQRLSLQSTCESAASVFFSHNGWNSSDAHFENHYNSQLQKCFVRIFEGPDYSQTKYGFITIQVYDAIEGKQYAEYDGYVICDHDDNEHHCSFNSGSIWFDANTSRNQPNFRVGFGGILYGGVGSENTQEEFIAATDKYFMNN